VVPTATASIPVRLDPSITGKAPVKVAALIPKESTCDLVAGGLNSTILPSVSALVYLLPKAVVVVDA